jgi:hypothetical protein
MYLFLKQFDFYLGVFRSRGAQQFYCGQFPELCLAFPEPQLKGADRVKAIEERKRQFYVLDSVGDTGCLCNSRLLLYYTDVSKQAYQGPFFNETTERKMCGKLPTLCAFLLLHLGSAVPFPTLRRVDCGGGVMCDLVNFGQQDS